ncbi:putative signal peptide protein [Rhodopirellula islandica]|uniref:Signal peptide protein n=1 Tax=Rhodopirellula islandica TaxID=595434 RepID=A0A0J1B894_RHOIS|nr:hypothetical protein [Rhodopirellula islandica]KLU02932.1 putative signal peptide protein [Rhodopirellula islandica]
MATTFPTQRMLLFAAILAAMALGGIRTPTASADWGSLVHQMHVGYHRNVAWPDPFNEVDAVQVVMPFEAMKRNGWRMHNTIGHELFRGGDGALLAAGQNRVRWIATQAPEGRREIHVLRGGTQAETESRLKAVREAVTSYVLDGQSQPQVFVTTIEPATSPGVVATKINRERLEQMAAPKLPTTSAAGTTGNTQ